MRILFITDGFPYPLTSGYLRHYHLIRALSARHEITLFSAVDGTFKEDYRQAMAPYTSRVMTFLSKSTKSKSLVKRGVKWVRTLFGRNQTLLDMRQALQQLLDTEQFDLVLLSGEYTYHVVRGLKTPPIVADVCDAYSLRTKGRMKHARGLGLLSLWIKYHNLKAIEQQVVERSTHVLFASERDAVIVPDDAQHKSVIVPNGVDTEYWNRSSDSLGLHTIIFTGAMHYPPNQDGAMYLLTEIAPLVRRSVPDVRILIVGHSPPEKLIEAAKRQPNVTVTGFVDDMRPYLEQATVFAAPLRFGSGIQNKVLEALAMELPVITTPIAADGLSVHGGDATPVRVAATTEQFARALVEELQAREADRAPFAAGRAFVERHFVWASSADKLERIIDAKSA
jgi:polysaccharide biosynthesis protein PslH